jgi:mono/diheme cytochrome c family protein
VVYPHIGQVEEKIGAVERGSKMRDQQTLTSGVLIVAASAAVLLLTSCKVSKPGSFETKFVNGWKHRISVGDKDVKNPVADTKENVTEGQGHFGHHCQVCHGNDGQNTGVPFAENTSPPVANLSSKMVQSYTDGQLKWIIKHGIQPSGMPAFLDDPSDDEQWKIVLFIRHLPPKGSLGIPDVYKEGEEEHEQMQQGEAQHHHDEAGSSKTPAKQDESKPHTHKH